MARVLGYGGLANTNGARDFTGKEESTGTAGNIGYPGWQISVIHRNWIDSILVVLGL